MIGGLRDSDADPKYVGEEEMDRSLKGEAKVHGHKVNANTMRDAIAHEIDKCLLMMRTEGNQKSSRCTCS